MRFHQTYETPAPTVLACQIRPITPLMPIDGFVATVTKRGLISCS